MNNINISEITLEGLSLSKINENGLTWRKYYRNSTMGRAELLNDFGQDIFTEVCLIWGETPKVTDPNIPEPTLDTTPLPTDADYLLDLDFRLSMIELGI